MTQERAVYRVDTGQPPLVGLFENVLQRVAGSPGSETGRVLTLFAVSLVESEEFDLSQIERLPDKDDRSLCLDLFEFCITVGLTEDERRAIASAFTPYAALHAPGTRH